MLRSMTGFGRCYLENDELSQQWEIRSVNSRFLDLKWRLPAFCRHLEPALEKLLRRNAARGRVEVTLMLRFSADAAPKPAFDSQQAAAMLASLAALAKEQGERFAPDYNRFLAVPSLWTEPEIEDSENLAGMLTDGLQLALDDWNEARESEGASLAKDIDARITLLSEWRNLLAEAAPEVREERVGALRERLAAILAASDFELDEDRFLQEIVILTDRLDVSEELTRLASHLERMRRLLADGREVGRKLDFTLQECLREINTCGNKLQDAELSAIVVDFKNELEKCREQAQNIE